MHEGDEDHVHLDDGTFAYVGERIELTSIGIDIGSSTSHLVFSGLVLERQGKRLSSRYVVTQREILNRSPVIFTPFTVSGQIDAPALGRFIAELKMLGGGLRAQHASTSLSSADVLPVGDSMPSQTPWGRSSSISFTAPCTRTKGGCELHLF